ncbi:hypothetical protein [uncultured Cardiobacterium sp.]|uniref:hypothetical protein n=1 Tax=uncultured Cardiobacterium sp. TaxID=417619 RepID=UPI0026057D56|nr:hypothetical protein [uncultured Cardiobacterium sp.]
MDYATALRTLRAAINDPAQHGERWHFTTRLPDAAELADIRAVTANALPEDYYRFIATCGSGAYFDDDWPVVFYDAAELRAQNAYYRELLAEELAALPPDAPAPQSGRLIVVGEHQAMGDWFGFDTSRPAPDFDIFIPDAAAPSTYAEEAAWRHFADWIVQCVAGKGQSTL